MKLFWKTKRRCALCLKSSDLLESHIYPRHIYKAFGLHKKNKEAKYIIKPGDPKEVTQIEDLNYDGIKEKLLCKNCEEHLNQNFERYFAELFISFPEPQSNHNITSTLQIVRDGTQFKELQNLDYTKVKLYVLSVLWRASVSKAFGKGIKISSRRKNIMRKMILNVDAGMENEFPIHFSQPFTIKKNDNRIVKPFGVFPMLKDPSLFYTIVGSYLIMVKVENKIKLPEGIENTWQICRLNKNGRLLVELLDRTRWFNVVFGMTGLGRILDKHYEVFEHNRKPNTKINKK